MTPDLFSDADLLYQDTGPMTPPLSPKYVQVIQAELHMPLPHVQSQPQQVHTLETSTQCVKTESVSCDTHDINTQLSLGEDYGMQSFKLRPGRVFYK